LGAFLDFFGCISHRFPVLKRVRLRATNIRTDEIDPVIAFASLIV